MKQEKSIWLKHTKRQWLLLLCSILLLLMVAVVPVHSTWLKDKVWDYTIDIPRQMKHTELSFRMAERFGTYYTTTQKLAKNLDTASCEQCLLLLPSTAYCKAKGVVYDVPEPVVFYYFTGVHTVWANSKSAGLANAVVVIEKGQLKVLKHCSPALVDSFVQCYKQYPYPL